MNRNTGIDAYRGFVMLLMMAEVLRLPAVARSYPNSWIWQQLSWHQSHVAWAGCSLHDIIQPSFSFLVGAALPYSIAARLAKGAALPRMLVHALWRSLILVALGIFLRSTHSSQTNYTFEDTLTQIGLGYPLLFLLGFVKPKWQWTSFGVILFGYWLAWALHPAHEGSWPYSGFLAHWNKNANLGHAFDLWFLNLFPRAKPFTGNGGGYLTLSFIPTLATMVLGLIAGRWLRESAPAVPYRRLLVASAATVGAGLLLHFAGINPIVKRIWTPAWTLFSGGLCFLLLAAFQRLQGAWNRPLMVIGMNSIAAYLIAHLFEGFFEHSIRTHVSPNLPVLVAGGITLLGYYLILEWMHRRKLYLRI